MTGTRASVAERLDRRTVRSSGCWLWAGARTTNGYGAIRVGGRMARAHRVAWELAYGPIPEGLDVLHRCDVPVCVNPSHLFLGTDSDNQLDASAKGRHGMKRHPERSSFKGRVISTRGNAKLTQAQVREIRSLGAGGWSVMVLAQRFSISESNVRAILSRETWRDLE